MKIKIEIDLDNAAFEGLDDTSRNAHEVARLLSSLASQLDEVSLITTHSSGRLADLNGNKAGTWSVEA